MMGYKRALVENKSLLPAAIARPAPVCKHTYTHPSTYGGRLMTEYMQNGSRARLSDVRVIILASRSRRRIEGAPNAPQTLAGSSSVNAFAKQCRIERKSKR
jgi:hypothetical protein